MTSYFIKFMLLLMVTLSISQANATVVYYKKHEQLANTHSLHVEARIKSDHMAWNGNDQPG